MTEAAPHSLVRTLRSVPLLAGCSEEDLLEIVGRSANLRWEAGERIFSAGDPADELFVVIRGEVVLETSDGTERPQGPGAHLGEAVLRGGERTHGAHAVDETELMVIPGDAVRDLLDRTQDR